MAQSFFIWNGVDCRSMGITLTGPAPIVRPEERVRHVEIPGRSGDLTQLEGEQIYNSYIQTVTIHVKGGFRVREAYKWLRGSGYVTFSGEPDRRQPARIIGAITLNKHSRNIDTWVGEVQFYCQPFKELLRPVIADVINSGTVVRNFGDVIAKPRIVCNALGPGSVIVVSAGGKTMTIDMTGMADTGCIVDCDTKMLTNYSGVVDLTNLSSGEFPELAPGDNTITGSGWASLNIEKRERFL